MMPTVTQQLQSMKLTMERVVLPALPDDATFAKEQAGLIWATLGWILDVHESELRYELDEAADYRRAVEALAPLAPEGTGDAAALLAEAPAGAGGELGAVRDQNRRLKQAAVDLAGAAGGDDARRILLEAARRQGDREAAWYRMTGFTVSPGSIGEVLSGQE